MTDNLDALARLVHEQRQAKNAERPRPFFLADWPDRTEEQKDLDRRIASAVAVQAVADAKLVNERMRMQLLAFAAERDRAIRDLGRRADRAVPGLERDTWLAAAALVRGVTQDRSEEEGAGDG